MTKTYLPLTNSLYDYVLDNSLREPEILRDLRLETQKMAESMMQTSADQAQFMALLVKLFGAKKMLEIGTFTGYSALSLALAAGIDAKIVCCDISEEWTNIAKSYWEKADVSDNIDLRLGPATETLNNMIDNEIESYDFAFIDADKVNYDNYFEACYKLIRPGGLIAIDNVLWGGSVIDPDKQDDDTNAIRALNEKLFNDQRIDLSMLSIADGLTLARKR